MLTGTGKRVQDSMKFSKSKIAHVPGREVQLYVLTDWKIITEAMREKKHVFLKMIALTILGNPQENNPGPVQIFKTIPKTNSKIGVFVDFSNNYSTDPRHVFRTLSKICDWLQCMKSVQMRSYFWSVFSCIWTEYRHLRSKSPYSVRIQENKNQK